MAEMAVVVRVTYLARMTSFPRKHVPRFREGQALPGQASRKRGRESMTTGESRNSNQKSVGEQFLPSCRFHGQETMDGSPAGGSRGRSGAGGWKPPAAHAPIASGIRQFPSTFPSTVVSSGFPGPLHRPGGLPPADSIEGPVVAVQCTFSGLTGIAVEHPEDMHHAVHFCENPRPQASRPPTMTATLSTVREGVSARSFRPKPRRRR